jgi:phosphoribosyl-AMP cyclohydrolase
MNQLEEGNSLQLDFSKLFRAAGTCPDIIPVAVQNVVTNEVILVAYTNERALKKSVETRTAVFWSTSRNELWEKGKTSSEVFDLIEIYVNCEQNSLLYKVKPRHGGICHTQNRRGEPRDCFYRRLNFNTWKLENINP